MSERPMKTLVQPSHDCSSKEQFTNGDGGCHARVTETNGMCPGLRLSAWLNSLPKDSEPYGSGRNPKLTNGVVRKNWIRGCNHLEEADLEREED